MNHDADQGFTASWGAIEWIVGAAWAAGIAVAGFLWRLATRVEVLEHVVEKNDEDTDRRHIENQASLGGIQKRLDALTYFIANGRKPPFEG